MKLLKFSFALLLAALFTLQGCSSTANDPDIQFAQTAFAALATGNPSAEGMLDWSSLKAVGTDVGIQYNSMPNDTEKAAFRQSAVASFASSFQSTGASADSLTNWRVQDATNHVVAADAPSGATLSLTISRPDGTQKISDIEISKQ
jgi:hypothetical protein